MIQTSLRGGLDLKPGSRVYFIGIGGISMSGLAEISHNLGFIIGGSDLHFNGRTKVLQANGATLHQGHDANNLAAFQPDLVVYTAAVHEDNNELSYARLHGLTTIDRATFLGWLNQLFERVINIAGTHGKTTTTALCSMILMQSGLDPTVHLGAELKQFHGTVRLGNDNKLLVSEACEYMKGLLKYYSTTAAILNIDFDHVDSFANIEEVIETFLDFADRLSEDDYLVVPAFDNNIKTMLTALKARRTERGVGMPKLCSFGLESDSFEGDKPTVYAKNLVYEQGMPRFDVYLKDEVYAHIELQIPGQHNATNALAAIACAHINGGTPAAAVKALAAFSGAEGRFTHAGTYKQAMVISDYAHHPAAARATLAAAANIPHEHIWVVFQPLTFSRTQVLFNDYVDALKDCELVIFSEIYSDRDTGKVSSRDLATRINELGGNAVFAEDFAEIKTWLDKISGPGDIILVLGPEDIRGFADQLTGRTDIFA